MKDFFVSYSLSVARFSLCCDAGLPILHISESVFESLREFGSFINGGYGCTTLVLDYDSETLSTPLGSVNDKH